ncbi:hypothetical protein [Rhodospira trueperi]|uniref:Uncharacterized protein n=1 Tax=Rhodospira trueperi TaxID=69960 RepID=A0A1G7H393_9PROT|nr:hypothetical protein [Rhodospira trueperi]SDE94821.1 hypothetical protein SAMN05421720_11741 [Rhodospira trueperi]
MTHHQDTIEALKETAVSVPELTALAWGIKDDHQEVLGHAKGMLLAAQRAGEKLLRAKKLVPHGQRRTRASRSARQSATCG